MAIGASGSGSASSSASAEAAAASRKGNCEKRLARMEQPHGKPDELYRTQNLDVDSFPRVLECIHSSELGIESIRC